MRKEAQAGMLMAVAALVAGAGAGCTATRASAPITQGDQQMPVIYYLEIVTEDVDAVCALYEQMLGVSFSAPDPDLGQARVATAKDGSLVGVRAPLAAHEQSIVRTYLAVDDIEKAVKEAEAQGAQVAYGPVRQGARGSFAILFKGGVQHGFWQK